MVTKNLHVPTHILTASNLFSPYAKIELQKSQHWFWEIYINPKIFDRQRMVSSCFLYIFSTEYQSDEANTLLQHLSVLFEAPVKRLGAMLGYRWHVCPPQCWMLLQHGYQMYQTPTLRNLGKKPETSRDICMMKPIQRPPRSMHQNQSTWCVRRIAHMSGHMSASRVHGFRPVQPFAAKLQLTPTSSIFQWLLLKVLTSLENKKNNMYQNVQITNFMNFMNSPSSPSRAKP